MISKEQQAIARHYGMCEKTWRLTGHWGWDMDDIKEKVPEETYKAFEKTYDKINSNKKNCLSRNQISIMAQYDGETLTAFINEYIANPKQGKEIFKRYFDTDNYSVKITCEVSGQVNDILAVKAKERGMSKTQYISGILTMLSLGDIE